MKSRQFVHWPPCPRVDINLVRYIPSILDRLQWHYLVVMRMSIHDEFRPALGKGLFVQGKWIKAVCAPSSKSRTEPSSNVAQACHRNLTGDFESQLRQSPN